MNKKMLKKIRQIRFGRYIIRRSRMKWGIYHLNMVLQKRYVGNFDSLIFSPFLGPIKLKNHNFYHLFPFKQLWQATKAKKNQN